MIEQTSCREIIPSRFVHRRTEIALMALKVSGVVQKLSSIIIAIYRNLVFQCPEGSGILFQSPKR